ncbi:MAG: ATP-binding protein [Ignavibacteriae bacterium]|nr:ATP-binding protein [Ignavibacteriota bacterium]
MKKDYKRTVFHTLHTRLSEKRKFIQVLSGPRQCGKTTLARQVIESLKYPAHYASADDPSPHNTIWIEQQWEIARMKAKAVGSILVLDEIQKVHSWSETVKKLWDEDSAKKIPLKILLLGSAPLLIQKGLSESLAGRFEIIPLTHWSFKEMHDAFGWTLEEYIYFGGYPGTADLISDHSRWSNYVRDALIETTISRDILLLTRVDKPALLRQLFHLGCAYSGQIVSYQKMLGQLHDAGNTTTLAHYLQLLHASGMLTGLQKVTTSAIRQRASSPKFQVLNTALISAQFYNSLEDLLRQRNIWGRLVESCVGAHLLNSTVGTKIQVMYWREGTSEVDFVLVDGKKLTAIEVKSGAEKGVIQGMQVFAKLFPQCKKLLVGGDGIPVREFLETRLHDWLT